ncbi:hypothetical protein ONS96_012304 [Cadophora gregata f. sp. sojae]|nr:hypothetical protein ONS96_012304 [Cadophora gregata f. sp. sojae]
MGSGTIMPVRGLLCQGAAKGRFPFLDSSSLNAQPLQQQSIRPRTTAEINQHRNPEFQIDRRSANDDLQSQAPGPMCEPCAGLEDVLVFEIVFEYYRMFHPANEASSDRSHRQSNTEHAPRPLDQQLRWYH